MPLQQPFETNYELDSSQEALDKAVLHKDWSQLTYITKHLCHLRCPYDLLFASNAEVPASVALTTLESDNISPSLTSHILLHSKKNSLHGSFTWLTNLLNHQFDDTLAHWSQFQLHRIAQLSFNECLAVMRQLSQAIQATNLTSSQYNALFLKLGDDLSDVKQWDAQQQHGVIIALSQGNGHKHIRQWVGSIGINQPLPEWGKIKTRISTEFSGNEKDSGILLGLIHYTDTIEQAEFFVPVTVLEDIFQCPALSLSVEYIQLVMRHCQRPDTTILSQHRSAVSHVFGYLYQTLKPQDATTILNQWLRQNGALFIQGLIAMVSYHPKSTSQSEFLENAIDNGVFLPVTKNEQNKVLLATAFAEQQIRSVNYLAILDIEAIDDIINRLLKTNIKQALPAIQSLFGHLEMVSGNGQLRFQAWRNDYLSRHLIDENTYCPERLDDILNLMQGEAPLSIFSNDEIIAYWLHLKLLSEEQFIILYTSALEENDTHAGLLLTIANHIQPLSLLQKATQPSVKIALLDAIQSAF